MSSTAHPEQLFALVDCNNFYVSCERVFNPSLIGKPVVVLSNNDGCAIARSKEAKAVGIPMGAVAFEYREIFEKLEIIACSSNYPLYGDMSRRFMQTLQLFSPEVEVYSIDEAFLRLTPENVAPLIASGRQTVLQHTGLPVSIGIGPTKTLAKLANHLSKSNSTLQGVYVLTADQEELFRSLSVDKIWGIGRQLSLLLTNHGLKTVWDLRNADDTWIKKNMSVVGLRTVWELRGISCLEMDEVIPQKKSIMSSKSFGKAVLEWNDLAEAIATYTARAAEKMRRQGSLASAIGVMIESKRNYAMGTYYNQAFLTLPTPSAYTPDLISYAKQLLRPLFKQGLRYKKVGIFLNGLVSDNSFQTDLFTPFASPKQQTLMHLIDSTNKKYGRKILKLAAEGTKQPWKMKQLLVSPRFTTRWDELLHISI